jgi:hypothetical protein
MIRMSIRRIRTSPRTMASACCRRGRTNRGTKLTFHTAPCPARAALKVGYLARRPPWPLRIAFWSSASYKQRRTLS